MKATDFFQQLENDEEFQKGKEFYRERFALGDAIIAARNRRHLTQEALANLVGTKQANISRIESGLANPTLELIGKICKTLDIHIVYTTGQEECVYFWKTAKNPLITKSVDFSNRVPGYQHLLAQYSKTSEATFTKILAENI